MRAARVEVEAICDVLIPKEAASAVSKDGGREFKG
jgi:hypothetical protein